MTSHSFGTARELTTDRQTEWAMTRKMTVDEQQDKWTYKDPNSGCWLWLGFITNRGYANSKNRSFPGEQLGHRLSYMYHVGPIPEGTEIDHLCRVCSCVNPAHLEAVTHAENQRRGHSFAATNHRKTHCLRGHEFTPDNTYISLSGRHKRRCKICELEKQHAYYNRNKLSSLNPGLNYTPPPKESEHAKTR